MLQLLAARPSAICNLQSVIANATCRCVTHTANSITHTADALRLYSRPEDIAGGRASGAPEDRSGRARSRTADIGQI
eukprot:6303582-Prymnesium_polylepis.2